MRTTLAECHVAAVAIAVLLVLSLESLCQGLWPPLSRVFEFVLTAIAILGIPYLDSSFSVRDRTNLTIMLVELLYSLVALAAATILSFWAYGKDPFRTLRAYGDKLLSRDHA